MKRTRKPEPGIKPPSQTDLEDLIEVVHLITEAWLIDHGRKKRSRRNTKAIEWIMKIISRNCSTRLIGCSF
jgi:hypothetical protein